MFKPYTAGSWIHIAHNDGKEANNCNASNGESGRKGIILLQSSRAEKLTLGILCLMANQTVVVVMTQLQI